MIRKNPGLVCYFLLLLPLSKIPLAKYLEYLGRSGVNFECRHLVWNHPHITPTKMNELIEYARRRM